LENKEGGGMLTKLRKGQSSLEYAALIGVVVGAVVLMSTYMRRSVEGSLRENSDSIGDQYSYENGSYSYSKTLEAPEVSLTTVTTDGTDTGGGNTSQSRTGQNRAVLETVTAAAE